MSLGRSRAAVRANALVLGQLAELIDDWQVAVVPPWRTGAILLLAPLRRWRESDLPRHQGDSSDPGSKIFHSCDRTVGLGACGFRREDFQPRLRGARLAARPSVQSLPISDLLPQFEILTPQSATSWRSSSTSRRSCRTSSDNSVGSVAGSMSTSVSSMTNACTPERSSNERTYSHPTTGWAKAYTASCLSRCGSSC